MSNRHLEASDVDLATVGQVPGLKGGAEVAVVGFRKGAGHPESRNLELLGGFRSIERAFPAAPGRNFVPIRLRKIEVAFPGIGEIKKNMGLTREY